MSDHSDQESQQEQLPPYVIEGARSGRSRCKTCRRTIPKGGLRLGIMIEGPFGTGYMWHHLNCAAKRQYEKVAEAYELESWRHAKEPPVKLPELAALAAMRTAAEARTKTRKTIPFIEVAPSGRSRCKVCEQLIEEGSVRVVLGKDVRFGNQVRTGPMNVHPGCVRDALEDEECVTEAGSLASELKANSSEVSAELLERTIGEIGPIDDV